MGKGTGSQDEPGGQVSGTQLGSRRATGARTQYGPTRTRHKQAPPSCHSDQPLTDTKLWDICSLAIPTAQNGDTEAHALWRLSQGPAASRQGGGAQARSPGVRQ